MKYLRTLTIAAFAAAFLVPSVALAAKPGGGGAELIGYDISWPQCGRRLPSEFYFAVVGVNGGTASNANQCLTDQLAWAGGVKPGSNQAKLQLYVNTANPGEVIDQVTTWPTTPYDLNGNLPNNPYGNTCAGANDDACSWLYGWNRSIYAESVFAPAATSVGINAQTGNYIWWLDVETTNTWQSGSNAALQRNVATLEGMASYYQSKGASVGLYSTAVQWGQITGNFIGAQSNLNGLANWRPSGSSLDNAKTNCSVAPLTTGGFISITQYVQANIDKNHSCI